MSNVDLTPEERAKIVAERADVKYGPFASLHEAYGVLAEEAYEVDCALCDYNTINQTCPAISELMASLQANDPIGFVSITREGRESAYKRLTMLKAIEDEIIDVIAVCDRIIAQWGEAS